MSHGSDPSQSVLDGEDQAIGGIGIDLVITDAYFEGMDPSKVLQVGKLCGPGVLPKETPNFTETGRLW